MPVVHRTAAAWLCLGTKTAWFCALILTHDVVMVQGSVAVDNDGPTLLGLGEDYSLG